MPGSQDEDSIPTPPDEDEVERQRVAALAEAERVADEEARADEQAAAVANAPAAGVQNAALITAVNHEAVLQQQNLAKYKQLMKLRTSHKTSTTNRLIKPLMNVFTGDADHKRQYARIKEYTEIRKKIISEWTIIFELDHEMEKLIDDEDKIDNHLNVAALYNTKMEETIQELDCELEYLYERHPEHPLAPKKPAPPGEALPPHINISPPDIKLVTKRIATIKLPQFALPTFSGDTSGYLSFMNHFRAAILNNETLPDAEKLLYLQTACKGDALVLISKLALVDENLEVALDLLTGRYGLTSEIRKVHLEALFNIPRTKENDPQSYRRNLQIFSTNLDGLTQCGIAWKTWKPLLMFMMTKTLDHDTRRTWEMKFEDDDQNYDVLVKFLTKRAVALECSGVRSSSSLENKNPHKKKEKEKKSPYSAGSTVAAAISSSGGPPPNYEQKKRPPIPPCVKCKQVHHLYFCKDFEKLNNKDRWAIVRDKKLCWNCLQSGHSKDRCGSKNVCKTCKGKHHSMLHVSKSAGENAGGNNN